jgi:gamma-glutamyl-gamma-aminobutyrate hydrolase PuuD
MGLIGVVGKRVDEDEYIGARQTYVDYFNRVGSVAVITPQTTFEWSANLNHFSVVVMPGGADIRPSRVGQVPGRTVGESDLLLEYFDDQLLETTLNRAFIVGICRGHQSLAAHLGMGGYFVQDLEGHAHSIGWTGAAHSVTLYENDPPTTVMVNSLHHQGIVVEASHLAEFERRFSVRVLATAAHDTGGRWLIIEAMEGMNFLTIQWHPEAINDLMVLRWIRTKMSGRWIRPPENYPS